jgi:hypothetical protein
MAKPFASIIGATTLALATALSLVTFVGCSDSTTGPSDSVQSTDPYAYLKVDETDLSDFSEIPTFDQVFNASTPTPSDDPFINPPDSTHRGDTANHDKNPKDPTGGRGHDNHGPKDTLNRGGKDTLNHGGKDTVGHPIKDSLDRHGKDSLGGHGPKDSLDHGRRDFGRMNYGSYARIIKQLNLTAEQDSLVRGCFKDYRDCASAAAAAYGAARRALADSMHSAIAAVRAQVDAGTLTKDQAHAMLDSIARNYRAQAGPLAADYRTATELCRSAFNDCVRGVLTAEQQAIWDRLVK